MRYFACNTQDEQEGIAQKYNVGLADNEKDI